MIRVCKFLTECLEDGLFSEFPHASYVVGLSFGDLLADNTVAISDVEKIVAEENFGRMPDSAKIFANIVKRMSEKEGERNTASFFKAFEWKNLWEGGNVKDEDYEEWIKKFDLKFLFEVNENEDADEVSADVEQGDDEAFSLVTKILSEGLGKTPIEALISEIEVCKLK
jgi:hypothetical protein